MSALEVQSNEVVVGIQNVKMSDAEFLSTVGPTGSYVLGREDAKVQFF